MYNEVVVERERKNKDYEGKKEISMMYGFVYTVLLFVLLHTNAVTLLAPHVLDFVLISQSDHTVRDSH